MGKEHIKRVPAVRQWRVLTGEYISLLWRDKKNLLISLLFPVMAAIITVWIAGENMFVHYDGTKSACFVIVSAAIWGGLFNSITTVVKARKIIKRNYIAGVRFRCYTASRAVVQFGLCMVQSAILSLSLIGVEQIHGNSLPENGLIFHSPMAEYYITILLLMYAADTMGLMISSMVRKEESANVLAPYILIVQLIFSGVLFGLNGTTKMLSYCMLSKWGMEALGSISNLNDLPLQIQLTVPAVSHSAEDMYLYTSEHLYEVWAVFLIFILGFVSLGNLLLHRAAKDSR